MHPSFCKSLAGIAWLCGVGNTLIQGTITLRLPRCGHHRVHNFLCEVPAVINLACTDIHTNEVQLFVAALVLLLLPVALILVSYGFIVQAVSKIKSFQAWHRALETCGSHLCWCPSSLGPAQPYTFNQRDSMAIARGSALHASTLL